MYKYIYALEVRFDSLDGGRFCVSFVEIPAKF